MGSMIPWPTVRELEVEAKVPQGIHLRLYDSDELGALPELWEGWYPTVRVGTESVFLDVDWLRFHAVTTDSVAGDLFLMSIDRDLDDGSTEPIGMISFQWEAGAGILHARLGLLAPHARVGLLGALGFTVFEALASLIEADVMMVRVTLASRIQQFMARRKGFRLCGVIPGADRNAYGDRTIRVTEALFVKVRVPSNQVLMPHPDALLPHTQALLSAVISEEERSRHPVAEPPG